MAEACKRGHPRTPENTYRGRCRACKRRTDARYAATPKGRAARRRAQDRYNATTNGYIRSRRQGLERSRHRTERRLEELAAEEAACLTS